MSARLLTDADLDAIAERVAALLAEQAAPTMARLVDAATLARELGLSRATVYARADELGAVRLGDGPRPRLRFDPDRARAALRGQADTASAPAPQRRAPRRRRKTTTTGAGTVLRVKGGTAT